jgi:glycosyltransferase
MTIKISIITATLNSAKFINKNLESVKSQTYKNIEHIIVDGLSNDNTIDLIRKSNFNMNNVITEKDNGIYEALNKGISASTGDIVGILHSDDLFEDSSILELIALHFTDVKVQAAYGNLKYINKNNTKIIRNWKSSEFNISKLKNGWMPPHPTLFIRKNVLFPKYLYNEKLAISSDYEMILKLFSQEIFRAVFIDKYLVRMRIGGKSNRSLNNVLLKMYEDFSVTKCLELTTWQRIVCILKKNILKLVQFLPI